MLHTAQPYLVKPSSSDVDPWDTRGELRLAFSAISVEGTTSNGNNGSAAGSIGSGVSPHYGVGVGGAGVRQWSEAEVMAFIGDHGRFVHLDDAAAACGARRYVSRLFDSCRMIPLLFYARSVPTLVPLAFRTK